jgi:hypothetical protein
MSILHDLTKIESKLNRDRLKFNVKYLIRNGGHRIPILLTKLDDQLFIDICHHRDKVWRILYNKENNVLEQYGSHQIYISKRWTDIHYYKNNLYLLSFDSFLNIEVLHPDTYTTKSKYIISYYFEETPAVHSFYCQDKYIVLFVRYHDKSVLLIYDLNTNSNIGTLMGINIKSVMMYNITDQWLYCKLDDVRCKINVANPAELVVLPADILYRKLLMGDKIYEFHGNYPCQNRTINSITIHMDDNNETEICFTTKHDVYRAYIQDGNINIIYKDQDLSNISMVKLYNVELNDKKNTTLVKDQEDVIHEIDEAKLMKSEYFKALQRWPNQQGMIIPCSTSMTRALINLIEDRSLESINDEDVVELVLVCDKLDFNQYINRLYDEIYLRCSDSIDILLHLISLVDLVPQFQPMILDWFKKYLNYIHHEHFKQLVSDHSELILTSLQNDVVNYKWMTMSDYRLDDKGNIYESKII